MEAENMERGALYQFKYRMTTELEPLKYIGHNWSGNGYWHQFEKQGHPGVWAELLSSDLWMIEPIEVSDGEQ